MKITIEIDKHQPWVLDTAQDRSTENVEITHFKEGIGPDAYVVVKIDGHVPALFKLTRER